MLNLYSLPHCISSTDCSVPDNAALTAVKKKILKQYLRVKEHTGLFSTTMFFQSSGKNMSAARTENL